MSEEGHERPLDEDETEEEERQSGGQQAEIDSENIEFLQRMQHYAAVLRVPLPYAGPPPGNVGSPDPNDSDRSDPNVASNGIGCQGQESDESDVDHSDAAVGENQIAEDQIVAADDGEDDEIDEGPPEMNEEELLEWDLDRDTTDPGTYSSEPWGLEDDDINAGFESDYPRELEDNGINDGLESDHPRELEDNGINGSPPKRRRLCVIS